MNYFSHKRVNLLSQREGINDLVFALLLFYPNINEYIPLCLTVLITYLLKLHVLPCK